MLGGGGVNHASLLACRDRIEEGDTFPMLLRLLKLLSIQLLHELENFIYP